MVNRLRWGLGVAGVLVLVAAAWPVFERVFGRTRLRFPYLGQPISDSAYGELSSKPGWARTRLGVAPGIELNGLLRRPAAKESPWVLFYPGNDESQLRMGQLFLSRLAGERDWGLAVFAYRGYDSSGGKSKLDDLRADAPEIFVRLCSAEGLSPSRVHIAGFSIGGHFAVAAAGGAAQRGKRAASLTLWAPVNDIIMYHASPWEKLTAGEDYQTAPYLAAVPEPVLVLIGSEDRTLAGPGQGRDIAQALGAKATYQELAGVDHVPLLFHEPALERMREFVSQHSAK